MKVIAEADLAKLDMIKANLTADQLTGFALGLEFAKGMFEGGSQGCQEIMDRLGVDLDEVTS